MTFLAGAGQVAGSTRSAESCKMRNMATRIGATQLARDLGDVLGRIRSRGESFVVERNGVLVAKIEPLTPASLPRLRDVFDAWSSIEADSDFADDLAKVGAADAPG